MWKVCSRAMGRCSSAAWRAAHSTASMDDDEPSTPTTMLPAGNQCSEAGGWGTDSVLVR